MQYSSGAVEQTTRDSPPAMRPGDPAARDGAVPTPERDPLDLLVDGALHLAELARELGMDMRALSRWAMQPDNAQALTGLLRLADARTQLALGRYRTLAATRLARIIGGDVPEESGDLVRKACVDMLTIDSALVPVHTRDDKDNAAARIEQDAAGLSRISDQAIILALEALSREAHSA